MGTEAVLASPESGHLVILQSPLDFSSPSALRGNATSLSLRAVKSRARTLCASSDVNTAVSYIPRPIGSCWFARFDHAVGLTPLQLQYVIYFPS